MYPPRDTRVWERENKNIKSVTEPVYESRMCFFLAVNTVNTAVNPKQNNPKTNTRRVLSSRRRL